MKTRIIAKLDVKPPYVVKPIHFEGLRKVGIASEMVQKYYEQGADEIIYIDIVSSLYQRDIVFPEIEKTVNKLFIPFSIGGAIQNIEDISKLFHIGADKVNINTYLLQKDPSLINQAAEIFGSQAISINIEAKKNNNHHWECYTDGGKIQSGRDVIEWAKEVEQRGAGEIILQSVDTDGRQLGFDLELSRQVVEAVNIPVVVASGAGNLDDIKNVINFSKPSGVAIASILHYDKYTINDVKQYLKQNNIQVSK